MLFDIGVLQRLSGHAPEQGLYTFQRMAQYHRVLRRAANDINLFADFLGQPRRVARNHANRKLRRQEFREDSSTNSSGRVRNKNSHNASFHGSSFSENKRRHPPVRKPTTARSSVSPTIPRHRERPTAG